MFICVHNMHKKYLSIISWSYSMMHEWYIYIYIPIGMKNIKACEYVMYFIYIRITYTKVMYVWKGVRGRNVSNNTWKSIYTCINKCLYLFIDVYIKGMYFVNV